MKRVFDLFYVNYRKQILLVALSCYCLIGVFRTSVINEIKVCSLLLSIFLILLSVVLCFYLFFDIILRKIKITPFLIIGGLCAFCSLIFVHNSIICFFIAFLYVLKNEDFNEIVKTVSLTIFIGLCLIVFFSLIGIIENNIGYRGDQIRVSFGFVSATQASIFFFLTCLTFNYFKKEKISYFTLLFEFVINFVIYFFTNTRMGFALTIVVIFVSLILKIYCLYKEKRNLKNSQSDCLKNNLFSNDKTNKVCSIIFSTLPVLVVGIFGLLVYLYGFQSEFIIKLNALLSNRLKFTYSAFLEKPITLFGGTYNWTLNGEYIGVDSAIYFYLFNWGIIPTLFIMVTLSYLFYKAFREKQYLLCFALFIILCDGVIDRTLFDIRYNVFLLAPIFLDSKMLFGEQEKAINFKFQKKKEKNMNKKVVAVVVTYNRCELLLECITALKNLKNNNLQILIIDNASTDGTEERAKELLDNNTFYFNTGENIGGAGGFNFGIKRALEQNADYIWLMDDDAIVQKNSLDELLSCADKLEDNFGYLSSKVLWKDNSICKMNIQRLSLSKKLTDFDNFQEIKLASFVSFFVKASVVEDMGLPIKEFFIWGDDWEYSARLSKKYNCYFVPNSVVLHKSSQNIGVDISSDSVDRISRYFYAYRNEGYFYRKQGFKGKVYNFLKRNLHRFKILKSKKEGKKEKLNIIKRGYKASKTFDPKIEYFYRPNTKIKVLECFGEPLHYGGQEAFIINMYKNFKNSNISYTFFTPYACDNKILMELALNRKEIIVANDDDYHSLFRKFKLSKVFKKFLKNNKFDCVHIHSGSVFTLLTVSKIAKIMGTKRVIVHSHSSGINTFKHKLIKKYSDKRIGKYADLFFACSKLAGEFKYPKEIMEQNRCRVINNGIDCEKFTFNEDIRQKYRKDFNLGNSLVLCQVGRFTIEKNHQFTIKILTKLKQKLNDFKMIFVGDGDLKEDIKKQLNDSGLIDNVIMLEKRSDVQNILFASDMFIFPSTFEGLGIVAVESQCTGLYTLASSEVPQEANLTDIIEFLPIDNEDVWVEKILENKDKKIGRKFYSEIIQNAGYDAKSSAKILEDIYVKGEN